MKKAQNVLLKLLPVAALVVGLSLISKPLVAQDAANPSPNVSMPQPADQSPARETTTFTGKIVKAGDKLVLTDSEGKTNYQLDDQKKAKEFVNQNVKVTGVLDASTGTIRVSAIDPS